MVKLINTLIERGKYILIIAIYFVSLFTVLLVKPIAKFILEIVDIFDYTIDEQQFRSMYNFGLFLVLTVIFVLLLRKELTEDFKKTAKSSFTHDEDSIDGINFFAKIAATYILYILIIYVVSIIFLIFPITQESSQNQDGIVDMATGGSKTPITLILSVVLLGPFVEEIVFRLAIFKTVRHVIPAMLLSTFIFAGIHINFFVEPFYLVLTYVPAGFALSLSYYYTDNIFVTIVTHMFMNGLAMTMMLT